MKTVFTIYKCRGRWRWMIRNLTGGPPIIVSKPYKYRDFCARNLERVSAVGSAIWENASHVDYYMAANLRNGVTRRIVE